MSLDGNWNGDSQQQHYGIVVIFVRVSAFDFELATHDQHVLMQEYVDCYL